VFGFDPDMIFRIPALLIALTVHEYAHARVAVFLGDPTPRYAGRLTLNPIPHLDPIGLLMLWIFRFGWAKPVPINPNNFRNFRQGVFAVSLAGPGANFVTAFICALVWAAFYPQITGVREVAKVLAWTYQYNLILAFFNLIPIPPLDGSQMVASLLPGRRAEAYERLAPYGPFILMGLVYLGVVGQLFDPLMEGTRRLFNAILALLF